MAGLDGKDVSFSSTYSGDIKEDEIVRTHDLSEMKFKERRTGPADRRDVAAETTEKVTGSSGAKSSHQAPFFHLLSPEFLRRCALRKTVGGQKYGWVQWRIGLNDIEYVADRLNHLWEHLLLWMQEGCKSDDNLGACAWALECLMEAERLCPEAVAQVVGISNLFGDMAKTFHEAETPRREAWQKRIREEKAKS